jgi:hypothetical protein
MATCALNRIHGQILNLTEAFIKKSSYIYPRKMNRETGEYFHDLSRLCGSLTLSTHFKVTSSQKIETIFSLLHDGTITHWSGDKNSLTLTVDCQYLAERIDKSFSKFYVELIQVDEMVLSTWPNPLDRPVRILKEPIDIFKAELEILSADVMDDRVIVACNQYNTELDYSGGNLMISCKAIKVFDQDRNELTMDDLTEICKGYWDHL